MKILITQAAYQDGDVVTYGGYSYVYINTTLTSSGKHQQTTHIGMSLTTGFKALGNIHTEQLTKQVIQFNMVVIIMFV